MKNLFVLCKNDFDVLLETLPKSDAVAYYFFSETKLLDVAIKQKHPDALLVMGLEFSNGVASFIREANMNYDMPIVVFGSPIDLTSTPNFQIHSFPNQFNQTELQTLFLKLKLIHKKPESPNHIANNNDQKDNEQFLNLLMDNVPDAIFFKDSQLRFTKINYAKAVLLGINTPEEAVGKSDEDFFFTSHNKKIVTEEKSLIKSGLPVINKLEHVDTPIGEKFMRTTKVPLMDTNGNCTGIVGISRDVTNEYLIEKELRQEKEHMDLLMNNVPDRIYFKDRDSRFIRGNMALAKILGVSSPEELYGKTDFDFHDPVHAKETFEDEQEIMSSLTPILNKQESFLKNGERFWEMTTKIPFTDNQNKVIGMVAVSHDYTEQKKLEEKLAKEKELLQILMDNVPDYIYLKDKDLKYIKVNKASAESFKVKHPDEIIGKSNLDLFPKNIANKLNEQDLEVFKSGKAMIDRVVKLKTLGGHTFWVSSTKVPIWDKNSEIMRLVGISRDVTMQEQTKQRFLAAKIKAEEANELKSLFLANMSHEIRTPMNGIIGVVDILSKSKLSERQREYLNIVMKSGQTLLSLINDILDFSKIESGKMELETVPISIRNIIEEVADIQIVDTMTKPVDILTYVDPKIPEFVGGDYIRLKQIITNLVNNAVKFTAKGEVLVRVDYIGKRDGSHNLQFKVKDSGIGIAKEDQKKIFESFSQVDPSTTRKHGGTGLGLVISQRLVTLMGGKLEVDSSIGKGSTFSFQVKFTTSEEHKKNNIFLSMKQLRKKHIVIVDDNETNRLIFRNYLKTWQVEVTEFENGLKALPFLKKMYASGKSVDLVLIDYQMPDMDGEELARQIKKMKQMNDLKLILLSSITDAIPIGKMEEVGFDEALNKPVKMNQLLNVILKVLGMQQEQEPIETIEDKDQYIVFKNKKFLIVEDNLVNIKVAQIVLSSFSTHIDVAKNGLEALDLFKTNQYDIILMDIRMPKMDGIEATIKIRALEKISKTENPVKIVATTANTFQEDIENCMKNGMDAFLEKPIKRQNLATVLRRLI